MTSLIDRMKKEQELYQKEVDEIIKNFPTLTDEDRRNLDRDYIIFGTCRIRYDGETVTRVSPSMWEELDNTTSYFTK